MVILHNCHPCPVPRVPCRGPCLSLPRLASCASNTRQGRGNLFAAHADDDNKFERQMMSSFALLCSALLRGSHFRLT